MEYIKQSMTFEIEGPSVLPLGSLVVCIGDMNC